jgi:predicted membrane-bound spermidine synthase
MSGWLFVLFFASGAAGLVYEIVWVRQFGLLFGSTVYSAALVAGIFMCGLGVGSFLAGRWADARFARGPALPLRAYGACELAIAAWALALVPAIPGLATLAAGASTYAADERGWLSLGAAGSLVRYGCAALALLPVTLAMGATLTLLIRHRIRDDVASAGWQVAALYAVNTAGAALGCLLTDTLLVPALGLFATQLVAVGLNVCAGAGAFLLARRSAPVPFPAPAPHPVASRSDGVVAWAGATLALGGFAAMALQIVWFRFLISLYGPYRPVFSLLLTIILFGIWLGSLLAGLLVRGGVNVARSYALALAGLGLYAAAALVFAPADSAARYDALLEATGGAWPLYRAVLGGALGIVGIPALLSGAAYPFANALVQKRADAVGERAGALYLSNTLGSVLGSLVGGLVLLPRLGMQGSTSVVLVALALAVFTLARASAPARGERLWLGASAAALLAALLAWQRLPPSLLVERTLAALAAGGGKLVAVREGVNETIAVVEQPFGSRLVTNGFGMSGTAFLGQRYMRAFVHVPLLIADRVERVMVMCFGVGNTVSAALAHPGVERVDVVDLSRDILDHAGHFAAANGDVLSDPRVRVHVNDARHHLRMLPGPTYDLITGEPPPLPHAGVVNLYTREFFERVRSQLRPGGLVSYWLPAIQIGEAATRSVVRAFLQVFPGAFLLDGHTQQLILLGRKDGPLALDPALVRSRIHASPALARDLRLTALDRVVELVGTLAATPATLERGTQGVAPLSDDHPALEYEGREFVRDRRLPADLFSVADYAVWCPRCVELPEDEREEIAGYLEVTGAWYRSRAFLNAQPGQSLAFAPALSAGARSAVARSVYLQDLLGRLPLAHRLALAAAQHGRGAEAVALLEPLALERPQDLRIQLDFAALLALTGRPDAASARLAELRRAAPGDAIWRDLDGAR